MFVLVFEKGKNHGAMNEKEMGKNITIPCQLSFKKKTLYIYDVHFQTKKIHILSFVKFQNMFNQIVH
jgi:hypothetical protein